MTDEEIENLRPGNVITNNDNDLDIIIRVHRPSLDPHTNASGVIGFFCDIHEDQTTCQEFGIKYLKRDRTFKL